MYRFLFFAIISSALILGCDFSAPPVEPADSDAGVPMPTCQGQDVEIVATVNGLAISDGRAQPLVTVLPGDSIALSAEGSCVKDGTITYSWTIRSQVGGFDVSDTADTDSESVAVSVYAERAGTYEIALTVGNGGGAEATLNAVAFEVPSWIAVDSFPKPMMGDAEFRDVSIGGGFLWVAAKEGAFRVPLSDPVGGPIEEINEEIDTESPRTPLPNDTRATFYEADRQFAWFSDNGSDNDIYRANLQIGTPAGETINVSGGSSGQIRDIAPLRPNGLVVASQAGIFSSPGSAAFSPVDTGIDAHAILSLGSELWVGIDDAIGLHKLSEAEAFDIFPDINDNIRNIIVVDGQLWIASDTAGIARVNPADPSDKTIYNMAEGHLPDDRVRLLAKEQSGDIWAATEKGIARFKADRGIWLTFNEDGVEGHINARAIAVDESDGERTVYVGAKGMAVIRAPTPLMSSE